MHARLNDHCTIRQGTGSGRELPPIRAEYYASIVKRWSAVKVRLIRNLVNRESLYVAIKVEREVSMMKLYTRDFV